MTTKPGGQDAAPVRRRRTRTRDRVLTAAGQILSRDGYARLTMERVAAESGAAKTTIYRRWPTKAALCMDLYLDVADRELHDPDTGSVAGDLRQIANTRRSSADADHCRPGLHRTHRGGTTESADERRLSRGVRRSPAESDAPGAAARDRTR